MDEVRGKVAVVTGAASGIGRGMAQAFADAGMTGFVEDVIVRYPYPDVEFQSRRAYFVTRRP